MLSTLGKKRWGHHWQTPPLGQSPGMVACGTFMNPVSASLVLRSTTTFQSGPQLGSLRPLEAGRAVFGKGPDQPRPRVGLLHGHPPAHLPAAAAGGGRGWAGQCFTGVVSTNQGAPPPLSDRDSRGSDPPLTRHFELFLMLCSFLGPGVSLGPRSPHYAQHPMHSTAPGPAPSLTLTSYAGSGKAQTLVPCPAAYPDRCPEHFTRYK